MLMNNLDPEVAEHPEELVVYGGIGRAARDWESFDRIVAALRRLEDDETLLVQSGKPVGVFRTHADAPRVLIANSNLVPHWATWEHFNELDRKGLMMYGQMTAGSWIYIGSQGIVQGTYETFVEVGRQHYGGDLAGKWILTAGLGGMGGAQPLAATMAGASMLAVECQPSRIEMRLRTGYLDQEARTLDEALATARAGPRWRQAGVGRPARQRRRDLSGARPARHPARRRHRPDLGPRSGSTATCRPAGRWRMAGTARARPRGHGRRRPGDSMAEHVRAMLDFYHQGVPTLDYGNNIRQMAQDEGRRATPSTSPASCRPISGRCSAAASARSAGRRLSRRSRGHLPHRRQGEGADPGRPAPAQLARHGARADPLPGPAGAHLLGRARRARPARPRLQRDGGERANSRRRS